MFWKYKLEIVFIRLDWLYGKICLLLLLKSSANRIIDVFESTLNCVNELLLNKEQFQLLQTVCNLSMLETNIRYISINVFELNLKLNGYYRIGWAKWIYIKINGKFKFLCTIDFNSFSMCAWMWELLFFVVFSLVFSRCEWCCCYFV